MGLSGTVMVWVDGYGVDGRLRKQKQVDEEEEKDSASLF